MFGAKQGSCTALKIPTSIFVKYFEDFMNDSDYKYFMYIFNSKEWLKYLVRKENWEDKLKSKFPEQHLRVGINKINAFKLNAYNLFNEGLDICRSSNQSGQ